MEAHGLMIVNGKLVADGKNPAATAAFIATLRTAAEDAEKRASATTIAKGKTLRANARAARRDANRIERSMSA